MLNSICNTCNTCVGAKILARFHLFGPSETIIMWTKFTQKKSRAYSTHGDRNYQVRM
jgi:hypothetical protein